MFSPNIYNELEIETHWTHYPNELIFGISPHVIHHRPLNFTSLNIPYERQINYKGAQNKLRRTSSLIKKDGYQVCMNVAQFKPSDINIKVLDNCVVVEGKHEERKDELGFIERHFVRRFVLPKGYDTNNVMSTLSSDGVLTVSVPNPQVEQRANERIVQIQQTGQPHLKVQENAKEIIVDAPNGGGDSKETK